MSRLRVRIAQLAFWTQVTLGLAAAIELPTSAFGLVGNPLVLGVTVSRVMALSTALLAPLFILIVVVSARRSVQRHNATDRRGLAPRFTLGALLLAVFAVSTATWVAVADYRGLGFMDLPRLAWLAFAWFALNFVGLYLDATRPKPKVG
jgi:hypothetical protein